MFTKTLALLTCAVGFISSAAASTIGPGTTAPPDTFSSIAGLTLVTSTTGTINPVPGTSFNANYTEWVYRDNSMCANCLDFLIQFSNSGPGIAERLTTSSFDGFITDVGYNTAAGSGVIPSTVDRSSNGQVIGFNFIPPGSAVNGGQTSAVLEIQTNAVTFTSGFLSIQDGVAGSGLAFQPSAVPEPKSTAVLFGACLLLGFVGWRKTRSA